MLRGRAIFVRGALPVQFLLGALKTEKLSNHCYLVRDHRYRSIKCAVGGDDEQRVRACQLPVK